MSIGAAGPHGLGEAAPAEVLGQADARLDAATRQGRDRVVTGG